MELHTLSRVDSEWYFTYFKHSNLYFFRKEEPSLAWSHFARQRQSCVNAGQRWRNYRPPRRRWSNNKELTHYYWRFHGCSAWGLKDGFQWYLMRWQFHGSIWAKMNFIQIEFLDPRWNVEFSRQKIKFKILGFHNFSDKISVNVFEF